MSTKQLATFVVETRDIPQQAVAAARAALIDTLGVGIAGTLEDVGEIAHGWARDCGGSAQATVWGANASTTAAEAAFVNGTCAHALDFDDSLPTLRGHPSAPMVAAALATGEMSGASGKDVLEALVLGLEVGGVLGQAVGSGHYLRGWHSTATMGAFTATAVAGRILKLDVDTLARAFGLAASQVSGLVRNFGTMTKPFHAGHAARVGVFSAMMAKRGFTADSAIFEGKDNFFETYAGEDGKPFAELVAAMGKPWQAITPGIYVKNWPCCYCNHRPIGGMLELMAKHDIPADDVKRVRVGFLPGSDTALVSTNPHTGLEGKFSIEYVMAALLHDRKLTLETFTDAMVMRPPVRALMSKVERYRIPAEGTFSGVVGYSDIEVETSKGKFSMRVERVPGSPEWPVTEAMAVQKFMDCAGRVLGTPGAKALLDLAQRCETLPNIRTLTAATIPASTQRSPAATAS